MIKLNTTYTIDQGSNSIVFSEGNKGSIIGTHNEGTLAGFLEGNVLKGTFHNTKVNASGLIEIEFHENGFNAKWKNGMEPGPLKGKWDGRMFISNEQPSDSGTIATQEFIKYIQSDYSMSSAYEGKIEATTDFVEDYSLEFDSDFFGDLKNDLSVVIFRVDNSEYSIDEKDGSDSYSFFYDFKNNCIYKQDPNEDDEYYCFLKSWHASIPHNYHENKKFVGCYSLSDLNQEWSVSFHGDFESNDGKLNEKILNNIKKNINSQSFYAFLKEVLSCL
jgi:hypothetical protein